MDVKLILTYELMVFISAKRSHIIFQRWNDMMALETATTQSFLLVWSILCFAISLIYDLAFSVYLIPVYLITFVKISFYIYLYIYKYQSIMTRILTGLPLGKMSLSFIGKVRNNLLNRNFLREFGIFWKNLVDLSNSVSLISCLMTYL